MVEFKGFPKISRLNREVIITEKIDGTNASVYIGEDGLFLVGSRTRWLTPQDDNYGFAKWAHENKEELMTLGVGHHFGEWWGEGIQRGYGIKGKRWSLFNTSRWGESRPACCHVVPTLRQGIDLPQTVVASLLTNLAIYGSKASPGFMSPEGVVIFHMASGHL